MHLLSGLVHFLTGFLQLLALLLHLSLVFGLFHALIDLVQIRQILTLLLAQAFELSFNFLLLLLCLGCAQGILQFLEFLVQILLSLGKVLQSAEDLQLFALLGFLQFLRLFLLLVAVLLFAQVQLVELALGALAFLLLLLLALAFLLLSTHLKFMGLQTQKCLVGLLFGGECRDQGFGVLLRQ